MPDVSYHIEQVNMHDIEIAKNIFQFELIHIEIV